MSPMKFNLDDLKQKVCPVIKDIVAVAKGIDTDQVIDLKDQLKAATSKLSDQGLEILDLGERLVKLQQSDDAEDVRQYSFELDALKQYVVKELELEDSDEWMHALQEYVEDLHTKSKIFDGMAKIVVGSTVALSTPEIRELVEAYITLHKRTLHKLATTHTSFWKKLWE